MSNNKDGNNANVFSKNDFASLFSTDMLSNNPSSSSSSTTKRSNNTNRSTNLVATTNNKNNDISHLGSSETALLLRQTQKSQIEKQSQKQNTKSTRYRAENRRGGKLMHHHQVDVLAGMAAAAMSDGAGNTVDLDLGLDKEALISESKREGRDPMKSVEEEEDDDDEEEDLFVEKTRKKLDPQVLRRRRERQIDQDQKSSSSSEDSDDSNQRSRRGRHRKGSGRRRQKRRGRNHSDSEDSSRSSGSSRSQSNQRDSDSSSSSSDNESEDEEDVDDRRSRLRARVLATRKAATTEDATKTIDNAAIKKETHEKSLKPSATLHLTKDNQKPSANASSSESSGTESSSEEESSSEDDSDDSDAPVVAKPLFVPKSKRGLIKDVETRVAEEEKVQQKKQEEKQKRTLQSRALLAEVLANESKDKNSSSYDSNGLLQDNESDNEGGGTHMPPPPDDDWDSDDHEEASRQRDAWQVRELLRILETFDKLEEEKEEKKQLEFRRGLSDREIMELEGRDEKMKGNHSDQNSKGKTKYMQRYFHRGAFYLDEDTLKNDPNDVRNRAKDYALAATGEDKIDKRNLPKVMQVKKFGFAGYSTKYKGLKQEDTTERGREYLPIKRQKRK